MSAPSLDQVKTYAAKLVASARAADGGKLQIDRKELHTYCTADGMPLYWRARAKCYASGEKWIRPFWWNGEAFQTGEPPAPLEGKPLYGLDKLAALPDALVIICEGESCVDMLNKAFAIWQVVGFVAITSGGAQSAGAADWQPLAGRRVFVWPDNDEQGGKYAADVLVALRGIAAFVAVLDIAPLNLPPKGDAVDWIEAGGTAEALVALVAGLPSPQKAQQGDESAQAGSNCQTDATSNQMPEPMETEAEILARLATLTPLEYDRQRTRYAELLNVRATALDAQVKMLRKQIDSDEGISFGEVEPWHERVKPDALLSEIAATVRRFIVCQSETADAVALWVAMTWFIDVVQVAPLAVITAPEKRCGKSQLLFLLGRLSCRPLTASNISPAALFRVIDAWKPTLLVDEADAFMRDNEELRGLLNCGHTRDSAYTVRIVGEAMTPTRFNVWGAKAIAGIGHLADTLMDRSVILELRRKLEHEKVDRLRHAEPDLFETLAAKLARFAEDHLEAVRRARPELPASLNDRAQDNWEPLLAIAEVAGGVWPATARRAALKLSGADSLTESVGSELLADIQDVFEQKRVSKVSTADLIVALCDDEEKGWATYNRGRPLTPRQLARKLDGYGIKSKNIRSSYEVSKGFERTQFDDAFVRYLSLPGKTASNPLQTPEAAPVLGYSVADVPLRSGNNLQSATLEPAPLLGCSGVADKLGETPNATPNHLRI